MAGISYEDETNYASMRGSFVDGQAWFDGLIPTALANNVTGITKANPGVVSSVAHGLSVGDLVYFDSLTEMTELNYQTKVVTAVGSADLFSINDTSGYGAAETTGGACGHSVVSLSTQSFSGNLLVCDDGDGDIARGFIGEAGAGETLGSNLFDQDGGSGGSGDKGAFTLADLRLAELNSGNLTVGTMYEISARTEQDFTADGAPDNNVGTTFIATGTNVTLDADDKVYPVDISWKPWAGSANTLEIDSGALKIVYVDDARGGYIGLRSVYDLSTNPEIGKLYKLIGQAKVGTGDSVTLEIYDGINYETIATITSTSFVSFEYYFIASSITSCVLRNQSMGAGEEIWLDNLKFYEVTEPNANAVKIYKERALVNEGWESIGSIDYNAGSSWDFDVYGASGGAAQQWW